MVKKPTEELLWRYPQLSLPAQDELAQTTAYRDIVLRGRLPDAPENPFCASDEDFLRVCDTPVGPQEVFCFANRQDFEHFVQVLCWRSAKPVPASMGAITVFDVANWRKIEAHKRDFLKTGGENWPLEFSAFTQDPAHFRETLVAVTKGGYSGLTAAMAGVAAAEWQAASLEIRIHHELTHVTSRRLFAQNENAVRDEVLADCIGLIAAIGRYDAALARKLLGVEGEGYRRGARLENYLGQGLTLAGVCRYARGAVDALDALWQAHAGLPAFDFLLLAERERAAWPGPQPAG